MIDFFLGCAFGLCVGAASVMLRNPDMDRQNNLMRSALRRIRDSALVQGTHLSREIDAILSDEAGA